MRFFSLFFLPLLLLIAGITHTQAALTDGEIDTRIQSIQGSVPIGTPAVTGYDQKGYVGSVLANMFDATQKIKSYFVLAFRDILGVSYNNTIPKWNGQSFQPGTMSDIGGNIGIGTLTPTQKLDVVGVAEFDSVRVTGPSSHIFLDQNNNGGGFITEAGLEGIGLVGNIGRLANPDLYVTEEGNIGIGTVNPFQQLHATSTVRFDGGIQIDGLRAISNTNMSHNAQGTVISGGYGFYEVTNSSGVRGAYFGFGNGGSRVNIHMDAADRLNISGGNVGIGVNDPSSKLEVDGNIEADEYCDRTGTNCVSASVLTSIGSSCPATTITENHTIIWMYSPCSFNLPSAGHAEMVVRSYSGNSNAVKGSIQAQCYNGSWQTVSVVCTGSEPSCFTAGTQVTMADGSKKNIEEVGIGEYVLGENGAKNKVLGYDRPYLGTRYLFSLNDGPYFVTAEHPFKTTDGWKSIDVEAFRAENASLVDELDVTMLRVGDEIIMEDGTTTLIKSIKSSTAEDQMVYNFHLDGNNTYFADGFLVHNKPDPF